MSFHADTQMIQTTTPIQDLKHLRHLLYIMKMENSYLPMVHGVSFSVISIGRLREIKEMSNSENILNITV